MRHHVIGLGRWGLWLARRLRATGATLAGVATRHEAKASELTADGTTGRYALGDGALCPAVPFDADDLLWVCLPDDQLAEFAAALLRQGHPPGALVHCSGAAPSFAEADWPTAGVLWPVQSVTAETEPDWDRLPLVVQSADPTLQAALTDIAKRLGGLAPKLVRDDRERQLLHLGAVLTQNFGNLLWTLTDELLGGAGLDYRLLLPLAENHLAKLAGVPPADAQTGPAARGDLVTQARHEAMLRDHADARALYRLASAAIAARREA